MLKFNVLVHGILFFYLSSLEKRGSSYKGLNCIPNDRKGNENWFELPGVKITVNV